MREEYPDNPLTDSVSGISGSASPSLSGSCTKYIWFSAKGCTANPDNESPAGSDTGFFVCASYSRRFLADCLCRLLAFEGFSALEEMLSFCPRPIEYAFSLWKLTESAACPGSVRLSNSLWLIRTESFFCRFSSTKPSRLILLTVLSLALNSCSRISLFLSPSKFATRCRKVSGSTNLFLTG